MTFAYRFAYHASMRVANGKQRTLSFKVTPHIDNVLARIRLSLTVKRGVVLTKTDVIEEAIRCLAHREKIPLVKTMRR